MTNYEIVFLAEPCGPRQLSSWEQSIRPGRKHPPWAECVLCEKYYFVIYSNKILTKQMSYSFPNPIKIS